VLADAGYSPFLPVAQKNSFVSLHYFLLFHNKKLMCWRIRAVFGNIYLGPKAFKKGPWEGSYLQEKGRFTKKQPFPLALCHYALSINPAPRSEANSSLKAVAICWVVAVAGSKLATATPGRKQLP